MKTEKYPAFKVEAHGIKGAAKVVWHRVFRNVAAMDKWAKNNDAKVMIAINIEPDYQPIKF